MKTSELVIFVRSIRQEVSGWPEWKKKLLVFSLQPYCVDVNCQSQPEIKGDKKDLSFQSEERLKTANSE